ncbi:MAG: peptide deformylase [Synergistaceae bacterium]|nr:peptide deformylase [Synergistaceae bacterium]
MRLYPDPILKLPTTPVERFDEGLSAFVDKMRVAMEIGNGVGLAAPQVGVPKKIAIVFYEDSFYALINPRVLYEEGEQDGEEGCLSFPDIYAQVRRPAHATVLAQNTKGEEGIYELEGFLARVFLHEIDHLNGKLFIDRLSPLKRGMIRKKMTKTRGER